MPPQTTTCSIDGCDRPRRKREWCETHYQRFRSTGSPTGSSRKIRPSQCTVDTCTEPYYCRGYCVFHYLRAKKGQRLELPKYGLRPLAERFWEKVAKTESCWLWAGITNAGGYGIINVKNVPRLAHRISLELHGIFIPRGMTVDHLCCVRPCINPAHLEVVTLQENIRREFARQQERPSAPNSDNNSASLSECPS